MFVIFYPAGIHNLESKEKSVKKTIVTCFNSTYYNRYYEINVPLPPT